MRKSKKTRVPENSLFSPIEDDEKAVVEAPKNPPAQVVPLGIDELTERLQSLFASDPLLKSVVLTGEVRELKRHSSGHLYFALCGENSKITCALFKQHAYGLGWLKDGEKILAEGKVEIYAARGIYQFIARKLSPMGKGAIEQARQEARALLESEGVFDPELKRPLPRFPEKIALVTSQTSAAVQDVIKVANTRWKLCEIVVVPTLVQGVEAPSEIVKALKRAAFINGVECVMLVRGGGGREDLVPFDDADVVRAVRGCPLPVITGLGHQQDTTLADMAADFFAPTPSAAAERLFPDSEAVLSALDSLLYRLKKRVENRIDGASNFLYQISLKMRGGCEKIFSREREALSSRAGKLDALSPLSVLSRGFAVCEKNGARVSSVKQIEAGDEVKLGFFDGFANARIENKGGLTK